MILVKILQERDNETEEIPGKAMTGLKSPEIQSIGKCEDRGFPQRTQVLLTSASWYHHIAFSLQPSEFEIFFFNQIFFTLISNFLRGNK